MPKIAFRFLDSFLPLRNWNLSVYLSGQAISLIGTWMQVTAQAWVVWSLTHSTAALGVVAMLGTLPILLLGPWTGVWADTLDRRRLLIVSQTSAMVLAITLALLVQTGVIQVWHVYVLATLLGIVTALDMPTQQAFIGDLSGMEQLRQAVVINNMLFQVSRMIGPALAGLVVARLGAAVSDRSWTAPVGTTVGVDVAAGVLGQAVLPVAEVDRTTCDASLCVWRGAAVFSLTGIDGAACGRGCALSSA